MGNILLAHPEEHQFNLIFDALQLSLIASGLCLAPKKVQRKDPLSYLGHLIKHLQIKPLYQQIRADNLWTLNDFQKLLDDINWIQPILRLTTEDLKPLFNILRRDSDPSSPKMLTPAAKTVITDDFRGISPHPGHTSGPS
jgi:hypothetical protein